MLIWKGWGIFAFLLPLGFALFTEFSIDHHFGTGFYKTASWPLPMALFLSSIPVFIVGHKLNKKAGRILVDPETDERIELKNTHSFFWIPMQYWSLLIIGTGVWIYSSNIGLIYQ